MWTINNTHTHTHRSPTRTGPCTLSAVGLLSLDVETRGLPPLAPPPRVCGEVYLTLPYLRKVKNSQARTGHQRGMGGRETDDDDTHERHTDTNKLTRHTASWLPHTLSWRTHNSGPHSSCRPPQHSKVPRETNKGTTSQQTTGGNMRG